jgi:hypothetical protein
MPVSCIILDLRILTRLISNLLESLKILDKFFYDIIFLAIAFYGILITTVSLLQRHIALPTDHGSWVFLFSLY